MLHVVLCCRYGMHGISMPQILPVNCLVKSHYYYSIIYYNFKFYCLLRTCALNKDYPNIFIQAEI